MKRSMCVTLLAQILLSLGRAVPPASFPERVRVPAAARQVVLDLCAEVEDDPGRAWTLEELSRRSGYGATRLTSLFRSVKGMPPGHWLSEQRIRYGRELLSNSEMSVEQIAQDVGFGSRSQFHRVFRELTGVTPGRYRAIQRQP
jgi:AraC-like DNA-binding protein